MSARNCLVAAVAAVFCCAPATPTRADLVAYWDFNGNLDNQIGGSVGTLQLNDGASLSTTETAPGNGGSHSLLVDGNDDFAFLDSAAGRGTLYSTLTGNFTVSTWGRSDVAASSMSNDLGYVWDIGSSHGTGAGTFFNRSHTVAGNGQIGAYYNSPGISSGVSGDANTWYNVTMTGDGSNVRLYVNGNYVGSRSQSVSFNTGYDFRVGSESKQLSREWDGYLDDVAIWNSTLPDSSIRQLAIAGASPTDIPPVHGDQWVFENETFDNSGGSTAVGPWKNSARWRYMTSSVSTYDDPGDFTDFTNFAGSNTWQDSAAWPSVRISDDTMHAGPGPSVVAWEADFDGGVAYDFAPSMYYSGTTTAYQLLMWDASEGLMSVLHAREDLDADEPAILGSVAVGVGDLIYFVLDNRTGSFDLDRVRMAATLTAVPEPSALVLALGAIVPALVLTGVRRRRNARR